MPVPPEDRLRGEEAFLTRWSRRKRIEPAGDVPVEDARQTPTEPDEEKTDEEILAELDLPDPETMKSDDDFSAFMKARVPERLRRRALRVLWRSNPVLANLDELVDYGEDYTDAATVMEDMQTVYEVGKGAAEKWKRHLAALASEKEAEDAEESANAPLQTPPLAEIHEEPGADTPEPIQPPLVSTVPDFAQADAPHRETPPPRPMRFSFD